MSFAATFDQGVYALAEGDYLEVRYSASSAWTAYVSAHVCIEIKDD